MTQPDDLARWVAAAATAPDGIRLILADIDGVLSGGEGSPFRPRLLEHMAAWNRSAARDLRRPAIALCSGRQAPYVELLAQLSGCFLPCIFEHGAGILEPQRFRFRFQPSLGAAPWREAAAVRQVIEAALGPDAAFVQPGKEVTLTLYPLGSTSPAELGAAVTAALDRAGSGFVVTVNLRGVEVRPPGIDKGSGARWLSDQLGVSLDRFAGVGDSEDDLTFLRLVGYPTAPANARPAVRSTARYVARGAQDRGFLEILRHLSSLAGEA